MARKKYIYVYTAEVEFDANDADFLISNDLLEESVRYMVTKQMNGDFMHKLEVRDADEGQLYVTDIDDTDNIDIDRIVTDHPIDYRYSELAETLSEITSHTRSSS